MPPPADDMIVGGIKPHAGLVPLDPGFTRIVNCYPDGERISSISPRWRVYAPFPSPSIQGICIFLRFIRSLHPKFSVEDHPLWRLPGDNLAVALIR